MSSGLALYGRRLAPVAQHQSYHPRDTAVLQQRQAVSFDELVRAPQCFRVFSKPLLGRRPVGRRRGSFRIRSAVALLVHAPQLTGDDVLDGGTGNDSLDGGAGDDALYSWGGAANMKGDAGYDFLYSEGSGAILDGGADDDYLYDRGTGNALLGGDGDDTLRTRGSNATAHGGTGDDTLWNQGTGNVLYGDAGSDYVIDRGGSTFGWKTGDGMDTVGTTTSTPAGDLSTYRFEGGDIGHLQATRHQDDLVVSTADGEGVTFAGWFTGESRMNIEAPDGTVWTPDDINAQLGSNAYAPSSIPIGQSTTTYWTGGTPIVFGSDFVGHDIQATLGYHYGAAHYDLQLSDGQGTSFTLENWSQGNVSSVTMPDGTTFTPAQLNAMLHPASFSTQYAHVYAQSDWQSVVSALGPAYSYGLRPFDTVSATMGGQQTGLYQGTPEPGNEIRRYTAWGVGSAAGGGIAPPEGGYGAVQTVQNINASWSITFDFWGGVFAIVDATSQYSNVVESREQARDIDGNLVFDFGTSNPSFVGVPFQLVSSQYNNAGYHDTPNVVTTRAEHLAETLYSGGDTSVVDSFTLFESGSLGARSLAEASTSSYANTDSLQARVSTGYLADLAGVPVDGGTFGIAEQASRATWSQASVDAWLKAAARLGEDLSAPTPARDAQAPTLEMVPTGEQTIRVATGYVEVPPLAAPWESLLGTGTNAALFSDSVNAFRLAA